VAWRQLVLGELPLMKRGLTVRERELHCHVRRIGPDGGAWILTLMCGGCRDHATRDRREGAPDSHHGTRLRCVTAASPSVHRCGKLRQFSRRRCVNRSSPSPSDRIGISGP
jgi:hypothetical protein